jgi:hypothetical protein
MGGAPRTGSPRTCTPRSPDQRVSGGNYSAGTNAPDASHADHSFIKVLIPANPIRRPEHSLKPPEHTLVRKGWKADLTGALIFGLCDCPAVPIHDRLGSGASRGARERPGKDRRASHRRRHFRLVAVHCRSLNDKFFLVFLGSWEISIRICDLRVRFAIGNEK